MALPSLPDSLWSEVFHWSCRRYISTPTFTNCIEVLQPSMADSIVRGILQLQNNVALVSRRFNVLSKPFRFEFIDIYSFSSLVNFVNLIEKDPEIASSVRELRVVDEIAASSRFWGETSTVGEALTFVTLLSRLPNLRGWSLRGTQGGTVDTTRFLTQYPLLLPSPPALTYIWGLVVNNETLPLSVSFLTGWGNNLQTFQLELGLHPGTTPCSLLPSAVVHLPNLHTIILHERNPSSKHTSLDLLARWNLPSLRHLDLTRTVARIGSPERFFLANGSHLTDLSWSESNSNPSFLPFLYLLPNLQRIYCSPIKGGFSSLNETNPKLEGIGLSITENGRERGSGLIEKFLGSINKRSLPALKEVVWESGGLDGGDLWKSMVRWLKKLEKEEGLVATWV